MRNSGQYTDGGLQRIVSGSIGMHATVPLAADVAAKILCYGVEALLAQGLDAVFAVRTFTCEALDETAEEASHCAQRLPATATAANRVETCRGAGAAPMIRISWRPTDQGGNVSCTCGLVASTARWTAATTMASAAFK